MSDERTAGCGCGSLILTVFVLWALIFGLLTPWGTLHLDLFPPAVRLETGNG